MDSNQRSEITQKRKVQVSWNLLNITVLFQNGPSQANDSIYKNCKCIKVSSDWIQTHNIFEYNDSTSSQVYVGIFTLGILSHLIGSSIF